MTVSVFFVGLALQLVLWPCLYFFSEWHFTRIIRRRRAQGNMSNSGHYGEIVIVFAMISVMCWIMVPVFQWIRSE